MATARRSARLAESTTNDGQDSPSQAMSASKAVQPIVVRCGRKAMQAAESHAPDGAMSAIPTPKVSQGKRKKDCATPSPPLVTEEGVEPPQSTKPARKQRKKTIHV
jgi:hypothetical protein